MSQELYDPPYLLKELKIEVTQACPLNCIHCSSDANQAGGVELGFKHVRQLVTDAKELGVSEIVFSGGEPLAWQNILDIISHTSGLDIPVCIYTTGRNSLNAEDDDDFPEKLSQAGLNRAVFSIYGRKSTYEKITRVNGSYEQTVTKIQSFQSSGIETEIHFVPLRINFRELRYVVDLARKLGIKRLSILRFVPHGRGALSRKSMTLSGTDNLELRRQIKQLRQKNPSIKIRLGSPYNFLAVEKHVFCKAGIDRLIIGPDGSAYPCDAFKNYTMEGSENDSLYQKTLNEIWESSHLCQKTRQYLSSKAFRECRRCVNFPLCKSGCLAQKVIGNGSFKKDKDPNCLAELMQ